MLTQMVRFHCLFFMSETYICIYISHMLYVYNTLWNIVIDIYIENENCDIHIYIYISHFYPSVDSQVVSMSCLL